MTTRETSRGRTPSGGVISEIYYLDENWKPVDKKDAKMVIVRELDESGRLICETIADIET